MVPLIVTGGGAFDVSRAMSTRGGLQEIADTAALSGARRMGDGTGTQSTIEAEAQSFANAQLPTDVAPSLVTSANTSSGIVTVTATAAVPTTFLGLIGINQISVTADAQATAYSQAGPGVCVHSISAASKESFLESGGSDTVAPGCMVWINSTHAQSTTLSGGSTITASSVCINGGISQGASNIHPTATDCGARSDPFASTTITVPAGCNYTNFSGSGTITLNPGVYCNGINLSGGPTVTLNPGVYYVNGGTLNMSGGGTMTGNGVTFVLTGGAILNLSGGGTYHLSAPTTGQTASFVIFQMPNSAPGGQAHLSGGGAMYYEGIIYFPTQELLLSGSSNAVTTSPWSAYVADTITYTGGGQLRVNWDTANSTVPVPSALLTRTQMPRLIH
jgi:hypothetical protein